MEICKGFGQFNYDSSTNTRKPLQEGLRKPPTVTGMKANWLLPDCYDGWRKQGITGALKNELLRVEIDIFVADLVLY